MQEERKARGAVEGGEQGLSLLKSQLEAIADSGGEGCSLLSSFPTAPVCTVS